MKKPAYEQLMDRSRYETRLGEILGLLGWDEETFMPKGAREDRGEQRAALAGIVHEHFTARETGDLLATAEEDLRKTGAASQIQKANLRELRRQYDRQVKVPKDLVERLQAEESRAHALWIEARKEKRFSTFAPALQRLVELRTEQANAIDQSRPAYDVLLESYEVGVTSEQIASIFAPLKTGLRTLLRRTQESKRRPNAKVLEGTFDAGAQADLGKWVAGVLGFSFDRGRMDVSVHPFCGGPGGNDVRMTTRYRDDDFGESFFAVIHETGHALYEQGLPRNHFGEPICSARSMAVHESQSLFWEKRIGLSREFWTFAYPTIQERFPKAFTSVDLDAFYRALHVVEPTLIRVTADEVTYPLHVMLRFDLERDLLNQKIRVEDLPEAWNKRMMDDLGIRPPNDAEGVLQDVHWSMGLFGYFPTYVLGAIYASQIFASVTSHLPNWKDLLSKGECGPIRAWLNDKIHQRGSVLETNDLIHEVTGQKIDATIHLRLLEQKYGEIYGL